MSYNNEKEYKMKRKSTGGSPGVMKPISRKSSLKPGHTARSLEADPLRLSIEHPSVTYIIECDPTEEEETAPTNVKEGSSRRTRSFGSMMRRLASSDMEDARARRKRYLRKVLRNMILYFIFIVLLTIVALGMVFPSMYYLTRALTQLFITKPFEMSKDIELTFKDVTTTKEFWMYCETILLDGFYWNYWYMNQSDIQHKTLLYENKLLGVPRLRQIKVREDSCSIHKRFREKEEYCYAPYSNHEEIEDTESFGLQTPTAWMYFAADETESITHKGRLATYPGGGFYQDFGVNRKDTEQRLKALKDNSWITRGTRCVFLDFAVYNPNLNLFCVAKLIFEFAPSGTVMTSYSFRTVKLIRYVTSWDNFVLTCEWLCLGFLIYFTLEEFVEMAILRWKYFTHFWNYVDLAVVITGFVYIIYSFTFERNVSEIISNNIELTSEYANFEYPAELYIKYNMVVGVLLFLAYIKIFKFLGFNKYMGQLNNTLNRCVMDLVAFSVLAYIMFVAYSQLGYLLFGTHLEEYSTVGGAMFTLFRTILGDFDYAVIRQVDESMAALFFLSYIFFVFFVLLNMFLAIINDTYSDVKSNLSAAPDELQMGDFLWRGLCNCFRKCGSRCCERKEAIVQEDYDITLEEIRSVLRSCEFTEIEIEMFFEKYNVDPTAEVGEFDVDELKDNLEELMVKARDADFKSSGLVTPQDFIQQEVRIGEIEDTIYVINAKVDALLKRLASVDIKKKATYPIPDSNQQN